MARHDRTTTSGTGELLQIAFEGVVWPVISIEQLLDRLAEPAAPAPDTDREAGTGTSGRTVVP